MLRKALIISCCLFHFSFSQAQSYIKYSRAGIHLDVAKLLTGIPEVQGELFLNNYLGVVAAGGYAFRPARGALKLEDGADLQSLRGAYGKFGIKGRAVFGDEKAPMIWLQAMYIISQYNERGTDNDVFEHNRGTAHGFAASTGADFRIGNRYSFRMGLQLGNYTRHDHLGASVLTYQPGFGSPDMGLPIQLMFAFNYKIGKLFQGPQGTPKF